jgi:hypothetical protein
MSANGNGREPIQLRRNSMLQVPAVPRVLTELRPLVKPRKKRGILNVTGTCEPCMDREQCLADGTCWFGNSGVRRAMLTSGWREPDGCACCGKRVVKG